MKSSLLDRVAFFALLCIVGLRPLLAEQYNSAQSEITASLGGVSDPAPVRTLVFVAVIVAAAAVIHFRHRAALVATGFVWLQTGALLVAAAAWVSSMFAGEKRIALTASADLLAVLALIPALVSLLNSEARRSRLLALILAAGAAQGLQCADQYFFTHRDTLQFYEQNKQQIWAARGVPLDSSKVELFERRMQAHESSGFLAHSNITGAHLLLCAIPAIAAVVGEIRRVSSRSPPRTILGAISAALIVLGLFTTQSLGSMIAFLVAMAIWLGFASGRSFVQRNAAKVLWVSIVVFGGCATAGIAHGLFHGTLPGASLAFRWEYWRNTIPLIADHGLIGVGRENFGRHYLQYKSIVSPEEIANPHNTPLQIVAELGVLGFLGAAAFGIGVVRAGWSVQRNGSIPTSELTSRKRNNEPAASPFQSVKIGAALAATILLLRAMLSGSTDPNYLYLTTALVALPLTLAFVGFFRSCDRLRTAVGAALIGFLLQDGISFALFVPATATTFAALTAWWISAGRPEPVKTPRFVAAVAHARIACTMALVLFALIPPALAHFPFSAARRQAALLPSLGESNAIPALYRSAAAKDPWDPTPLAELASYFAWQATSSKDDDAWSRTDAAFEDALRRDPYSTALHRGRLRIQQERLSLAGRDAEVEPVVQTARTIVALYPNDPAAHVSLGVTLLRVASIRQSRAAAEEAAREFEKAIALDDSRPVWETIRRLRDRERIDITEWRNQSLRFMEADK